MNNAEKILRRRMTVESRGSKLSVRGLFPGDSQGLTQRRISTGLPDTLENRFYLESAIKSIQFQGIADYQGFKYRIEAGIIHFLPLESRYQEMTEKLLRQNTSLSKQVCKHDLLVLEKFVSEYGIPESDEVFWSCASRFLATTGLQTRMAKMVLSSLRKVAKILGFKYSPKCPEISQQLRYKAPRTGFRNCRINLDIDRILESHGLIQNCAWKNMYALIACYGLRNCEAYNLDLTNIAQEGDAVHGIKVLRGKTGERFIPTIEPDLFNSLLGKSRHFELPVTTQDSLQAQGQRVTAQFRRFGIDHTPYDLRHSWCIRLGRTRGYAVKEISAMTGHSLDVFEKTYHQAEEDSVRRIDLRSAQNRGTNATR